MSGSRAAFVSGVRDTVPILFGVVPFAVIAGATTVAAGVSPLQTLGLSLAFVGAAQLALVELLGQDASVVVIVVATTIINSRLSLYSASLAPYFRSLSAKSKLPVAYVLNDHSYALSIVTFEENPSTSRLGYYFGSAFAVWLAWQLGELAGIALGQRVPPDLGLDFIVSLVFVALLFSTLEDRATVAAALAGGGIALVGVGLPFDLGLLSGAFGGILVGTLVEAQTPQRAGRR